MRYYNQLVEADHLRFMHTGLRVYKSMQHGARLTAVIVVSEARMNAETCLPFSPSSVAIPDGACIPMNCRGMELLGLACNETIYFCVHQCSVELWKLYDTPRVSIQKKILDLRIQLLNSNKEQIKVLRRAGIIENFRATMIAQRDTERLFDALEQSRRKRGLLKHALKAKASPNERGLRVEEQRARRLRVRPLVGEDPRPVIVHVADEVRYRHEERCALNGDVDGAVDSEWISEEDGELLVAQDVELVPEVGEEIQIEVISNNIQLAGQLGECVPIQRMEHSVLVDPIASGGTELSHVNFSESYSISGSTEYISGPSPKLIVRPVSRLSSPALESSEYEERSSTCSNSYTRSLSASPRRPSASPERFLFLSAESNSEESEEEELPGVFENVTYRQSGLEPSAPDENSPHNSPHIIQVGFPQASNSRRLNQKKPAAIKLRHLAKATSPPGLAFRHSLTSPSVSPTPLIISISLSMLRHQPQRQQQLQKTRRVALSSFVMKKRASSRISSTSSDASYRSDSPAAVSRSKKTRPLRRDHSGKPAPSKGKTVQKPRAEQRAAVNRACHSAEEMETDLFPSRRDSATRNGDKSFAMDTSESSLQKRGTEGVRRESVLGANCNSNNRTHAGTIAGDSSSAVALQDDDQISISSSSTNSMSNGSKGNAAVSTRRRKSARNLSDSTGTKATFSFDELFSFYPPKLVVRDGELELEHTMSVKHVDRWHHLPENHPLLRWTPGQPVKGMTVIKTKKKRGASY